MKIFSYFIFALCALFLLPWQSQAQRRRTVRKRPATITIDTLRIRHALYHIDSLQMRIDENAFLQTLMHTTQQTAVVDSQEIAAADLFRLLPLSADNGTYIATQNFPLPQKWKVAPYAQCNAFKDKIYFSAQPSPQSPTALYVSLKTPDGWSFPEKLHIYADSLYTPLYPFMMPDGVTLYFSAKSPESAGGYDIFVTRYNADRKMFLQPQNLGLPFSTLADDVFFAIDEQLDLGVYATHFGGLAPDSLCLYTFIPSTTERALQNDTLTARRLLEAMRMGPSLNHPKQRDAVQKHLNAQRNTAVTPTPSSLSNRAFVVNDHKICTQISDFSSKQAGDLYKIWCSLSNDLDRRSEQLEHLRQQYHERLLQQDEPILQCEREWREQYHQQQLVAKKIRQLELRQP